MPRIPPALAGAFRAARASSSASTAAPALRTLQPATRPSLLARSPLQSLSLSLTRTTQTALPIPAATSSASAPSPVLQQVRHRTFGTEYQPSQLAWRAENIGEEEGEGQEESVALRAHRLEPSPTSNITLSLL
ncbi:unnamed protein product [Peniophora sp. CBMAI 1063]|nr:unnamed protein product [Peniophora sp. CBMAI 1063]